MNASPDEVVQALYGSDNPADRWPRVANALRDYLGATTVRIMAFSCGTSEHIINTTTLDWPERFSQEYDTHYLHSDPRIAAGMQRLGTSVACVETMDARVFEKTALVCDFLDRPEIDGRWGVLHMSRSSAGQTLLFGAGRPRKSGPFLQHDKDRLDVVLAPIKRALDFDVRLALADQNNQVLEGVLDALTDPIIVLSDTLRVLHVNARAASLLAGNSGLRVTRGRLHAVRPADQTELERIVRDATTDGLGATTQATVVRLDDGPVLLVRAYRLPMSAGVTAADPSRQCALVITTAGNRRIDHGIDAVLKAFGLTAAELKLVRQLLMGVRLSACATEAGVSIETVRSQLKSAREKVGVRSQSDLIRFLAQYG